ncbi:MAG: ABC transporter permease [Eubacterium sp.]|nr:ABC transporter permease [Eubacterium sp.]
MLNLINMNVKRLFKTRALYATTIILFGLFFFIALFAAKSTFDDLSDELIGSGMIFMLVGIFATVYSDEERKSGFLKNLDASKKSKINIFLSKIPVILLYNTILVLTAFAALFLGKMGNGATTASISAYVLFLLFRILAGTAYGTAFLAIYEIARGNVVPTILTVFAAFNLHGVLINMVEKGVGMNNHILSNNLIVSKAMQISVAQPYNFISVLLVVFAWIILYSIIGMIIFQKRDVF